MTTPLPLTCTWSPLGRGCGRVLIDGDLAYDTADRLLGELTGRLRTEPGLVQVHLDCTGLRYCDSYGLSTLLMIRRLVHEAGASLHLDNRGPALERILELTSTREYLTGDGDVQDRQADS